jgi:serine/threonine-protein kinase
VVGGRYVVDGQLGQGGMARVFDAVDERLHRRVAIKILHPETEAMPGMQQRFQQEARIAARLIHPNIVAVLDYGEDGDSCYLVMERLPGRTFRDEMARGPLPPDRVTLVITETLAALTAAHRFGVLHRDIKPSNILIQEDGHIKITDFGIAKSLDLQDDVADDVTQTGIVLGTPGYLAPERRSGQPATVRSDLYSVGAVMVEALTARRPGMEPPAYDELPAGLRAVAARSLTPDPSDRFDSAEAMYDAVQGVPSAADAATVASTLPLNLATAALPVEATTPDGPDRTAALLAPPVAPSPPLTRRAPKAAIIGIAGAAVLVLLVFLLLSSTGQSSGPPASATSHGGTHRSAPADSERTAIRSLATSLASGGLPGDGALASALQATAAQPPGAARQAAAEQALLLGSVLLAGGGISPAQYQDVVSILEPTGAAVPTTTTTQPPNPAHDPGPGGHKGQDGQGG